ncbi:hypothetical protein D9619_010525 [Psilocybe cf. subviscida]|uniref:Uncharacterized protein n=1 Tax=Psilocybe cf. subviscida TaxID=2480587 RepID=A0A8H5ERN0_9AGAR|nr:hypothetical protein D9619_010525 [Psilocybe cf. subviscida]
MMRDENVDENPESWYMEGGIIFIDFCTPNIYRRLLFLVRLCPGENIVDSSIWVFIASMIATLDISKAVDDHGSVIEPKAGLGNPIFRIPDQFKSDMCPRSQEARWLFTAAFPIEIDISQPLGSSAQLFSRPTVYEWH